MSMLVFTFIFFAIKNFFALLLLAWGVIVISKKRIQISSKREMVRPYTTIYGIITLTLAAVVFVLSKLFPMMDYLPLYIVCFLIYILATFHFVMTGNVAERVDPELLKFIQQAWKKKMSDEEIRNRLLQNGWSEEDINRGLDVAENNPVPKIVTGVLVLLLLPTIAFIVLAMGFLYIMAAAG